MLKKLTYQLIFASYCYFSVSVSTGLVLCIEQDGKIELEESCNKSKLVSPKKLQVTSTSSTLNQLSQTNSHCESCFDIPINQNEANKPLFKNVFDEFYISTVQYFKPFDSGNLLSLRFSFQSNAEISQAFSVLSSVVLRI